MWNPEEWLKLQHTKVLMQILKSCRKCGDGYGFYHPYDDNCAVTLDQAKAELATREHVPNKQEAKAIRQEAAIADK